MVGRREVTLGGLAALASTRVRAQPANGPATWPTKPIRLIVPYGPGGSADQVARLYAEKMSASLGQQIIVEDKPSATVDVFDGRIQMVFDPSFVPYARSGKVIAALIDQPARLPDLPDTPTATEVGLDLKGFRARSWFGLFAPRGTPEPVLARLSQAVAQTVEYQSNVEFARQVRDDQVYFARLLKDLDIRLE